jgi:glycosyltransferase involved in cell wall biosynthesis
MKILFISMHSVHTIRWLENLQDAGHELYWFDVLNRGSLNTIDSVTQFTGWSKRKLPYIKGEYLVSKKWSSFYNKIQPFLEVTADEKLYEIINDIKPDLIHSFEMQSCSYPIQKAMQKFPSIKWMYSCWGSDLYYYQTQHYHLSKIKNVLNRINYLHTDCERDFTIAKKLGFEGKHVGVIPGGGGYNLSEFIPYLKPIFERNIILVKGYQHHFGRGLVVVKALASIQTAIEEAGVKIIIFGAHQEVVQYIQTNQLDFEVFDRNGLSNKEVLELLGKSSIYIGNSISDGMPNTLLEAIIMGAFPIQSNPGNVTAEIITDGENGFLIEHPNSEKYIANLVLNVLINPNLRHKSFEKNQSIARNRLDYQLNKQKIVALYQQIQRELCE